MDTEKLETSTVEDTFDPDSIDVSSIPDSVPKEEVKGLKATLEKLKELNKQLKTKAALVDQLSSEGVDPSNLPQRLKELKEAQAAQERLDQIKAELEAAHRAKIEELQRKYQEDVSNLTQQIKANDRRHTLEQVLARGGGSMASYDDFAAIASRYLMLNEDQKIVGIKPPPGTEGETLYVEDEKQVGKVRQATVDDFLIYAKLGKYGPAIQAILPPLNQASGSGLPNKSGLSPGKLVLRRSQLSEMGKLSESQLAAIRNGDYTLID